MVHESMITLAAIMIGIPGGVASLGLWLHHRRRMTALTAAQRAPEADARLERIEQAIEVIALEMERVGEGQRFLTKVLSDGLPAQVRPPSLGEGRVITPH
jgi:hypothetical protein